jgi:hypothetical protein
LYSTQCIERMHTKEHENTGECIALGCINVMLKLDGDNCFTMHTTAHNFVSDPSLERVT